MTSRELDRRKSICGSITECIGQTPSVLLRRVPQMHGIECEVVAKCEFLNPGGSVKDRIGLSMIEAAEQQGTLKPGSSLIEPSSGNTGIALAMVGAVKGYPTIITMPTKMSHEKSSVLTALGATVIRTPLVAYDHPESLISVAKRLAQEQGLTLLDQYNNPANPQAHYRTTAEEIYEQCGGKIDMVVISAGTGGTLSGVAKRLKELCPNIIVVGVDPVGSILADPSKPAESVSYQVEGIGYDFVPAVCDRSVVDRWVKTEDKESLCLARELQKYEGMLVGGSCGSAMSGVIQAAKGLSKNQRCVVVFPDGIRNYMSKFVDDNWMIEKGFMSGTPTRQPHVLEIENDLLKRRIRELEEAAKLKQ